MPEAASTLLAPMRMGYARAFSLLAMGRPLTATEAKDAGIVNTVVEAATVDEVALAAAHEIAALPPSAVAVTRALMRGNTDAIIQRIDAETRISRNLLKSDEARAAFLAFLAARNEDDDMSLKGKTLFITGASRGIGLAIGLRAARDGANVAIAAKTAEPHPKLAGTIYTAAEEIERAGGRALPLVVDVREELTVKEALDRTAAHFGGIDIVVNNASAIALAPVAATDMKRFDLMHQINTRGTFVVSKWAIPHLQKAPNPHILMISPPLDMKERMVRAAHRLHHGEVRHEHRRARTCRRAAAERNRRQRFVAAHRIATAAVQNLLGGDGLMRQARKPDIMADAAYAVFSRPSREFTGQFLIDDNLLAASGVTEFDHYRVDPTQPLAKDFFVPDEIKPPPGVSFEPLTR